MAGAPVARTWSYPYGGQPNTGPQARQAEAHRLAAAVKELLYGGAAGGGKTDWLLAEVLANIFRYKIDALVLRRTFPQLNAQNGIIVRLLERIPAHIGTYNATEHRWTFVGGGSLVLGFLRTDADVGRYIGGEFHLIAWDQVEEFTEWQYRRMFHPLRIAVDHPAYLAGFRPGMICSANPGGPGHHWVKSRWIDPAPPGIAWQPNPSEDEPKPGSRAFVPATVEDNAYASQEYRDQLESMPEDERRALRWGDWDVYSGARFGKLWRRPVHVIDPEQFPTRPGGGYVRAIGIDYGMDAPFCALWGLRLPDGLVVVYRELYAADLTPAQQAEAILLAEAAGERIPGRPVAAYLDPSCWARQPGDAAKAPAGVIAHPDAAPPSSIASDYLRHGVPVTRANNDRRAGTARIADALRVRKDGLPRLLIYSTCRNLIRTLPGLPRDDRDPELYDTTGEDHAADALRYLLMGLVPEGARDAVPVAVGPSTPGPDADPRPPRQSPIIEPDLRRGTADPGLGGLLDEGF